MYIINKCRNFIRGDTIRRPVDVLWDKGETILRVICDVVRKSVRLALEALIGSDIECMRLKEAQPIYFWILLLISSQWHMINIVYKIVRNNSDVNYVSKVWFNVLLNFWGHSSVKRFSIDVKTKLLENLFVITCNSTSNDASLLLKTVISFIPPKSTASYMYVCISVQINKIAVLICSIQILHLLKFWHWLFT